MVRAIVLPKEVISNFQYERGSMPLFLCFLSLCRTTYNEWVTGRSRTRLHDFPFFGQVDPKYWILVLLLFTNSIHWIFVLLFIDFKYLSNVRFHTTNICMDSPIFKIKEYSPRVALPNLLRKVKSCQILRSSRLQASGGAVKSRGGIRMQRLKPVFRC